MADPKLEEIKRNAQRRLEVVEAESKACKQLIKAIEGYEALGLEQIGGEDGSEDRGDSAAK